MLNRRSLGTFVVIREMSILKTQNVSPLILKHTEMNSTDSRIDIIKKYVRYSVDMSKIILWTYDSGLCESKADQILSSYG
jgi:hypothetical protein